MKIRKKNKITKWIDFIIICCFLRPHLIFIPDIISVYLFDLIIIFVLLSIKKRIMIGKDSLLFSAGLFLITVLKTIFGLGDIDTYFSFFKLLYYFFIYTMMKDIFQKGKYSVDNFEKIIKFCYKFNIIIALIQLLDVPVISTFVHLIYGKYKLRSIWGGYPRIYGTFYNANWFGIYLIFMVAFFTHIYCRDKKAYKYIIQIIFSVILLLLSGSRTSLIGSAIAVIIVLFSHKNIMLLIKSSIFVTIFLSIGFRLANKVPLFAKTLKRFTSYFAILFSKEDVSILSLSGSRWNEWVVSFDYFKQSLLLGSPMGTLIPHNTYIAILIRFGLFGSLFIVLTSVFMAYKYYLKNRNGIYMNLLIAFLCALLVVMISGDYLFTTQVMLILIILGALNSGVPRNTKKEVNNEY